MIATEQFPENHVIVGELLESKCSQQIDLNTPKSMPTDISWNPDSDASHATGGYNIGFSLTVLQVSFFHANHLHSDAQDPSSWL